MLKLQRLEVSEVGDVTVVSFRDQRILEDLAIQEIGLEFTELVQSQGRTKIVLNFSAVAFMSSAALGKLISFNKLIKGKEGVLVMCDIRPEIREVFEITRLDRLFTIKESEKEALAAI